MNRFLYFWTSFTLCAVLAGTTQSVTAQQVVYNKSTIKADGIADEPVWQDITPLNGFQNFFPINDGAAEQDTDVRIYQDGKYLNVLFVYHDVASASRVNSLKRDNYGAGFHLSDCVGIIIDPYGNQNAGYFFALNGAGVQLDALIANYDQEDLAWDTIWESGHSVQGTDKIYEFKIPLSALSYDGFSEGWYFQFYTRDAKQNLYTVWNKFERGYLQFDTRFLRQLAIENLAPSNTAKNTIIPAISSGYQHDIVGSDRSESLQPSLDLQRRINAGLRLDATINPDFSQVEVDQQVANLTRFNIVFPERRNFFIENSDMFSGLGAADDINPFYSRFIGATEDILMGLKLSGNASSNTRIGLLNVQSKRGNNDVSQNYTVAVARQQLGSVFNADFNATGYLVNRDALNTEAEVGRDYNRVLGAKLNYLSKNRRWSGFSSYSASLNDGVKGDNDVLAIENSYQTRTLSFTSRFNKVGENYITDIGFVPRVENYDALSGTVIREGYTHLFQDVVLMTYPQNVPGVEAYRPLVGRMWMYFDEEGEVSDINYFYNTALFLENGMSAYINVFHDDVRLKYAFDPLRNGRFILPANYKNTAVRVGYNSNYTNSIYGSVNFQRGSFYDGDRSRLGLIAGFRLSPIFSLEVNYEYNKLSFDDLGNQPLHLLGVTTELFINNKLNWTTYLQYNEQIDNININSRLQWEYKPLSFVYLVFTDNYTEALDHKSWGVSLKVNRRLNF